MPRLLVLANLISCLPLPLKYHVTFRLPVSPKAREKMAGIVNKVYLGNPKKRFLLFVSTHWTSLDWTWPPFHCFDPPIWPP